MKSKGKEAMPEETTQQQSSQQWLTYPCPFCEKQLYTHSLRAIPNERTGQVYITTRYLCVRCDFHMTTRVPRKLAVGLVGESYLPQPEQPSNEPVSN